MLSPSKFLTFFIVSLLGFTPLLFPRDLEVQRDGNLFALTYNKPISCIATFEQTTDLVSWNVATTFDELISDTVLEEVVRSSIALLPNATRFFMRLRVDQGRQIALTWNPSPSQDVTGYWLHYGSSPGNYNRHIDVGNQVKATIPVPIDMKTCYFVVTAYNFMGLQSPPSRELKVKFQGGKNKKKKGKD